MTDPGGYYACAEVVDGRLTITVSFDGLENHAPGNFEHAALGLAMIGVGCCIETSDARAVLNGLARQNRRRRAEQAALKPDSTPPERPPTQGTTRQPDPTPPARPLSQESS